MGVCRNKSDTTCLSSMVLNKGQWAVTYFKPRAAFTGVSRLRKEQKEQDPQDCIHSKQVYCAALCGNALHTEGHWTDKLKTTRQTDRGPLDRELLDRQRTARQPLKGQTNLWGCKECVIREESAPPIEKITVHFFVNNILYFISSMHSL